MLEQPLDPEIYRLIRDWEAHLKSLPPDKMLEESQLYIDGKKPIGSLQPLLGDFTDQPYRNLRIQSDGLVYVDF